MEDKNAVVRRLFMSKYSLDRQTLASYDITANDVSKYATELVNEGAYSDVIQILRKAQLVWPNEYNITCRLMLTYINTGDFMNAHDEMLKLEGLSQEHDRKIYYIIRALKTYYNIATSYKIPTVYEFGHDYRDAYKKWDLLSAQMYAIGEPMLHKVLEEINSIIIERKINESTYYDTFDSMIDKLASSPKSIETRDDLAIFLYENGLSRYQDFFMYLMHTRDPRIMDYFDTVTRGMKVSANELFYEMVKLVKENKVELARLNKNLLKSLPSEEYPEIDTNLNSFIIDRAEFRKKSIVYKTVKQDTDLEKDIINKSKLEEEIKIKETDSNIANKIEYILQDNNIMYEYEIIDGVHVFTLNKVELNETIVEVIDDTITWNIDNIEYLSDKVVNKCTPIQRAVKKLPKNQKVRATLMIARDAFNAGKIELAVNILKYVNELSMQLSIGKEEVELRNTIQEKVRSLHK